MERKFLWLKRHPLTTGLSDPEIQLLGDGCQVLELPTGEHLHQAGQEVEHLFLVAQGRLKQLIMGSNGIETLLGFLVRGTQFGGLAAVRREPVAINVVATEPSIVLRLEYQQFLEHTRTYPQLLINFIQLLGDSVKQHLRMDRLHQRPKVVLLIHDTPESRPLAVRLVDRLRQLGEAPGVITDDLFWRSRPEVDHLLLVEDGQWVDLDQARRQIVRWSAQERVLMEVSADIPRERLLKGMEIADLVLVCIRPENWQATAQQLTQVMAKEPQWRQKTRLVWMLKSEALHPPLCDDLRSLVNGDFKLSFEDPPAHWSNVWKHGVERIVHELRGVRVGIALGGGAARGMAHLGVLKTLEDNGIIIDMIAGTSAGAMTGTVYATGMDVDFAVQSFVRDLTPPWLFRKLPAGGYWYLLYKYRRQQFDPMLRKYLSNLQLQQLPIPMNSITVDLVSGEPKVRDRGDAVKGIVESINLPGLSAPICHDGEALVDGGLVNNVPADVLVHKGCNYVIAASVTAQLEQAFGKIRPDTPGPNYKVPSALQTIMRGYLVQSVNMNSVGVQPADLIIEPDVTQFDLSEFTKTDELAAIGAETTSVAMDRIRQSLSEIDSKLFQSF